MMSLDFKTSTVNTIILITPYQIADCICHVLITMYFSFKLTWLLWYHFFSTNTLVQALRHQQTHWQFRDDYVIWLDAEKIWPCFLLHVSPSISAQKLYWVYNLAAEIVFHYTNNEAATEIKLRQRARITYYISLLEKIMLKGAAITVSVHSLISVN